MGGISLQSCFFCLLAWEEAIISLMSLEYLLPSLQQAEDKKRDCWSVRWHKVENQEVYQDAANPTKNVHCRSRPANLSQLGAEPEKGSQLQDTLRKTAGAPGKGTAATPKEAQQEPIPHPEGGEEDTAPPSQKERNPTHIHRDHQRWGPAAKTHKTDGAKKATP